MSTDSNDSKNLSLRQRAELKAKTIQGIHPETISPAEAMRMVQELQVQQIALEMQNEELRHAQEELKAIYDHAPVLICVVDAQRHLLYANAAFTTFTGIPEAELKGGRACGVFGCVNALNDPRGCGYGTDCPNCALRLAMEDTLKTGIGHHNIEYSTTLVRDGQRRDVSLLGTTSRLQAGGQNHLLLCLNDITARKRAEAEREKLEVINRQLHKFESMGRMAAAIAHHFNNKLSAVIMNLEMAKHELPPAADLSVSLTAAMESARKAAEVSSLMLIYLGHTQGKREPLDLSVVCQQSLSLLRATLPQNVVLDLDLPIPGPVITADTSLIQQVLTNLVTNACEACGEGHDTISIRVKTFTGADLPGTHRFPIDYQLTDNAYACLEVQDTGCGIADKDMEKIFDPFFSTKFTGRGLGLPVVLGIVRTHRGVITIASKPDQGSVFRVFFACLNGSSIP